MSDDLEDIQVSSVRISSAQDRIRVVTEERLDIAVEGAAVVTYDGDCPGEADRDGKLGNFWLAWSSDRERARRRAHDLVHDRA